MNHSTNAMESFALWYNNLYGDNLRPNFSYDKRLQTIQTTFQLQVSEFFYCTQFGSTRHVTLPNATENVFPNVIAEQYYDQWCTDLFGGR